jgi:hypothetical protein
MAFRIARTVAPDRMISTVDPEARHGRKTSGRSFDGYKGHVGRPGFGDRHHPPPVTAVMPEAAEDLLADMLPGTTQMEGGRERQRQSRRRTPRL